MVYHPWLCGQPKEEKIAQLQQATGLPALACGVLAARGIDSPQAAQEFLRADPPLSSPSLMAGIEAAAARIRRAVDSEELIAVFGDYDVDGVCATALMYSYLESLGANVFYKLPNRADEGYGLCNSAIQQMADRGITLIITVDNGVSAASEVAFAKSLGVDVVVTDHHIPPKTLPEAVAVVDPQLPEDTSPCKSLAGVGVAFKVICAVDQSEPQEMIDWYGDLVAVGTIADIMSLTGENRAMVRRGLELLQENPRPRAAGADRAGRPVRADADGGECQLWPCAPDERRGPDGRRDRRAAAAAVGGRGGGRAARRGSGRIQSGAPAHRAGDRRADRR